MRRGFKGKKVKEIVRVLQVDVRYGIGRTKGQFRVVVDEIR